MKKENWIWMPHAGHLIVGNDCRFHLNTYVGGYIVSTVGEYVPDSVIEMSRSIEDRMIAEIKDKELADFMKREGFRQIGLDRFYETMVFKAAKALKENKNCCPWRAIISKGEVDFDGYLLPHEATVGHMAMCKKWGKV